jgi:hypothetical protein
MKDYKYKIMFDSRPLEWAEKHEGKHWGYSLIKNYGDCHSAGGSCQTQTQLLYMLEHMVTEWMKYDSILDRYPDDLTKMNTWVVIDDRLHFNDREVWKRINKYQALEKAKHRGKPVLESFFG